MDKWTVSFYRTQLSFNIVLFSVFMRHLFNKFVIFYRFIYFFWQKKVIFFMPELVLFALPDFFNSSCIVSFFMFTIYTSMITIMQPWAAWWTKCSTNTTATACSCGSIPTRRARDRMMISWAGLPKSRKGQRRWCNTPITVSLRRWKQPIRSRDWHWITPLEKKRNPLQWKQYKKSIEN